MEEELLRSKTEMMLLNNQVLEAVQKRLEMSLELEAWKVNLGHVECFIQIIKKVSAEKGVVSEKVNTYHIYEGIAHVEPNTGRVTDICVTENWIKYTPAINQIVKDLMSVYHVDSQR